MQITQVQKQCISLQYIFLIADGEQLEGKEDQLLYVLQAEGKKCRITSPVF